MDQEFTQRFDSSQCLSAHTMVYAKWQPITEDMIVIETTSTEINQTLRINKYFANAYTVDWGDESEIEVITADTTHTYTTA